MANTRRLRHGPAVNTVAARAFSSLGDLIAFHGRMAPSRSAILAPGRAALTYGALWRQTKQAVCLLRDIGVGRHDRVAVVLPHGADAAVAMLAVAAGAACVPLYPGFTADEWRHYFGELRVKALVTSKDVHSPSRRAAHAIGIPVVDLLPDHGGELGGFGLVPSQTRRAMSDELARASDDAFVLLTSGTTSRAKMVPLTHASVCLSAYNVGAAVQLAPRDRLLSVLPLFHGHGLISGVLAALAAGSSVVCPPVFDAGDFFACLSQFRPTWYTAVPAIHRALLSEAGRQGRGKRRCSLRLVRSASSSLPADVLTGLEALFGVPVIETYGMTEAATQIAANPLGRRKLNSVGTAAGPEIAILDAESRRLAPGERGEIALHGPTITRGYENDAVATASAFRDGWFRTGDLGYLDAEGYLFIVGRIKQGDVINRGGQKVSPVEVEQALRKHPDVLEAAAFPIPHERLGEDLAAAVVLHPDAKVSVHGLRRFASQRLARFKVPGPIHVVAEIPKDPESGLDRRGLLATLFALPSRSPARRGAATPAHRSELALQLASTWAELLGLDRIEPEQDVFALGADSLTVTQMLSRLRTRFGVTLSFEDIFDAPTVATLATRLESLARDPAPASLSWQAKPTDDCSVVHLSFQQQRIHVLSRLDPTGYNYHLVEVVRLFGPLDAAALQASIASICVRHEVLRTTFGERLGEPIQTTGMLSPRLERLELGPCPKRRRAAAVRVHARELLRSAFDMERAPLLRAQLLRFEDDDHALVIKIHHLITDGWSQRLFWEELAKLYAAKRNGIATGLPALPVQYRHFVEWQRAWLRTPAAREELSYWRSQLQDLTELPLRTDRPRPQIWTGRGARHPFKLSRALSRGLKSLSRDRHVTLFMTLLAAFQCLLYRYTQHADIAVGSLIANRNQIQSERLMGMFANTIVLRSDLSGDPRFGEVLRRARHVTLDAYRNQDIPIEEILRVLQVSRSMDRNALFKVMFILQSASAGSPSLPGLSAHFVDVDPGTAQFDLTLEFVDADDRLCGWLEYNTDLFDAATVARMAAHLQTLLAAIAANPEQRISRLPLLPKRERRLILIDWNDTRSPLGRPRTFVERFAGQAERTPQAVAVSSGQARLTYRELAHRSAAMADRLSQAGIGPNTLVILFAERTVNFLAAMIAVQRAGGAFLPLDPASPAARVAQIVQHSRTPLVLAGHESVTALQRALLAMPLPRRPQVLCLEQLAAASPRHRLTLVDAAPSNLAYVIYTSGSTGAPKGAMVEQRGLFNHLCSQISDVAMSASDVVAQTAPQSFVLAVWQFLAPLMVGARVHICGDDRVRDPAALVQEIGREGVTVLQIVPVLLRAILEQTSNAPLFRALGALRWLMCCGEALPPDLVRDWFRHFPNVPVINAYGSTEVSDDVATHRLRAAPSSLASVPIGRPIANTRLYVLDPHLQPVPIGMSGVLCVGGIGVGRGYLNDPELTRRSFLRDPFAKRRTARLYRTGDLARWRADGTLEFLGRVDHQVKLRGCRIELAEIEHVLAGHPDVQAATVLLQDEPGSEARLIAYVVSASSRQAEVGQLRDFLKARLPDYMIPAGFVFLARMPLTAHGKVDRRALADMRDGLRLATAEFVAPRDPTEAMLAGIWANLLGVASVGIHDNFFDLGGHSLLAGQVLARAGEALGVTLPLKTLFEAPTVEALAIRVNQVRGLPKRELEITPAESNGSHAVSIVQEHVLRIERELPGLPQFNVPFAYRLQGVLNVAALERSLAEVVRRHHSLRTGFSWVEDQPLAIVHPIIGSPLRFEDLAAAAPADSRRAKTLLKEAELRCEQEAWTPFNVARAPLFRARLLRLAAEDHVLLLTFHHIIVDGWSIGIFTDEISRLYSAFASGRAACLPEPALQFSDFARWQRSWCATDAASQQRAYWQERLRGGSPMFPAGGHSASAQLTASIAHQTVHLPADLTARLAALSRAQGATLFMTLLAGFKALLMAQTGRNDICVATSMANRSQLNTESLIGLLANTTIIRTQFEPHLSFQQALRRMRAAVLDTHARQELPFAVLGAQAGERDREDPESLIQVFFDLRNALRRPLTLADTAVTPFGKISQEGLPRLPVDRTWLTVTLKEEPSGISGSWAYKKDLLGTRLLKRWIAEYKAILTKAAANPALSLRRLSVR